jgi:ArsR family transcriptional regulator
MRRSPVKTPRRAPAATGSIPSPTDGETARLSRALAHPARVAILRLLMNRGDCICGEIVDLLPLAQATVSQHLKVLKQAGLIEGEVDGPRICYCVNPKAVRRFKELVEGL